MEAGIGRRLEPHEGRALQRPAEGLVARRHEPHLDAVGPEHVARDGADPRVGVGGRDEHVAGVQPGDDHGADGGHPSREDDAVRALVSLGYAAVDAERAVRSALDDGGRGLSAPELIRKSLGKIRQ